MNEPRHRLASFEETYPRYPFAELVRLALGFGKWIVRRRRKRRRDVRNGASAHHLERAPER